MSYKKLPSYLYSKDKNLQYINYLKLKVDSIYAIIEERRIGMEKPKFRYIITHGFTKKTQKTPKREIIHAKQIRREFEEEYHANN